MSGKMTGNNDGSLIPLTPGRMTRQLQNRLILDNQAKDAEIARLQNLVAQLSGERDDALDDIAVYQKRVAALERIAAEIVAVREAALTLYQSADDRYREQPHVIRAIAAMPCRNPTSTPGERCGYCTPCHLRALAGGDDEI